MYLKTQDSGSNPGKRFMRWFGLEIRKEISISDIKILLGGQELAIVYKPGPTEANHMDFYLILEYILKFKKRDINCIFGLFLGDFYELVRKRAKNEIALQLTPQNFIFLLEGGNIDAYYANNRETEGFWGVELRYSSFIDLNDWNDEWYKIQKYILKKKNE